MFSLRDFIFKGLKDAVGKMADYQVILNAAGWLDKGVLTEDDLSELNILIEAQYIEEPSEEMPTEETEAENENIS